jgi:serine protease SohB
MLKRKSAKLKGKNPEPGWLTRLVRGKRKMVSHIRLKGAIGMNSPFAPVLSLESVQEAFEPAFAVPGLSAVAISVNSPGGSPVQSTLMFNRIRQLSDKTGVKVIVFCEDVAASGGYLLAVAGDEIFADRSSIVGSIGVISAGFGFSEAIAKIGVERRVYTAGTNKSVLDPFLPARKQDIDHLKSLQLDVHDAFKDIVRTRRAGKLNGEEDKLFSGLFWAGDKAFELGLIDGIGSVNATLRERFGDDVIINNIDIRKGFSLKKLVLPGGGAQVQHSLDHAAGFAATSAMDHAVTLAEERALWSRYGI